MNTGNQYDVIIIGGSYAGLAAAMALGRALRKVLIIDSGKPGNSQTPYSHNFLTNDGKTPKEISAIAKAQVQQYKSVKILKGVATSASKTETGFAITIQNGTRHTASKLVFATGIKDIMLPIPGYQECWGISVLHCPYCHGYEVKNQKTGVLGNGDGGFEFASLISNWTDDLTLYTNGKSTLSDEQAETLKRHRIRVVENKIQQLKHKKGYLQQIQFINGSETPLTALYSRTPFIQHSNLPEVLGCELSSEGYIKVDQLQRTTVAGIFACGDNTVRLRTVANAVAAGTTAGMMLNKELIEETF